jgi:hypothetical protein
MDISMSMPTELRQYRTLRHSFHKRGIMGVPSPPSSSHSFATIMRSRVQMASTVSIFWDLTWMSRDTRSKDSEKKERKNAVEAYIRSGYRVPNTAGKG